MGKLAFAHMEDESGKIQLWISRADLGDEWFDRFRDQIDLSDIVQATGTLRRTKTGEASIAAAADAAGQGPQPAARCAVMGFPIPKSAIASATSI